MTCSPSPHVARRAETGKDPEPALRAPGRTGPAHSGANNWRASRAYIEAARQSSARAMTRPATVSRRDQQDLEGHAASACASNPRRGDCSSTGSSGGREHQRLSGRDHHQLPLTKRTPCRPADRAERAERRGAAWRCGGRSDQRVDFLPCPSGWRSARRGRCRPAPARRGRRAHLDEERSTTWTLTSNRTPRCCARRDLRRRVVRWRADSRRSRPRHRRPPSEARSRPGQQRGERQPPFDAEAGAPAFPPASASATALRRAHPCAG